MNSVAFIFARGGSKGLPNKNIKEFCGMPLIAWSIEQALAVDSIEKVYVSTDSYEIAEIAKHYSAEVPFIRPPELATDTSPELDSWRHALDYIIKNEAYTPDYLVSIPTTAPLRLSEDIENCICEYEKGMSDVVITVTESHHNPYFNMVTKTDNAHFKIVNDDMNGAILRRQDSKKVYNITTIAYVANPQFIFSTSSILNGRVGGVIVPADRSIDIDTPLDFEIAEYLMQKRLSTK